MIPIFFLITCGFAAACYILFKLFVCCNDDCSKHDFEQSGVHAQAYTIYNGNTDSENTTIDITALNPYKYKKSENGLKSCVICLDNFKIDDELIILSCLHTFHKSCVERWFKINSHCPICRSV